MTVVQEKQEASLQSIMRSFRQQRLRSGPSIEGPDYRYSGRTSARWSNLLWQPGHRRWRALPMASMQTEQKAWPHLITRSFCRRALQTWQ